MSFLKKILKTNIHNREREDGDRSTEDSPVKSKTLSSPHKTKPSAQVTSSSSSSSHASTNSTGSSSSHITSPHTTYQVKSSTNRHVAQVLPGLLLGSQEFAQDLSALTRFKVSHILNMTGEVSNAFPDRFTYQRVAVADMPHVRLDRIFTDAFEFIDNARSSPGGCVLVHCYYGASRSASIVLAYLMRTERMRYREALAYLQMIRPEVYPNDGFDKQLREYEQKLLCTPISSASAR